MRICAARCLAHVGITADVSSLRRYAVVFVGDLIEVPTLRKPTLGAVQ